MEIIWADFLMRHRDQGREVFCTATISSEELFESGEKLKADGLDNKRKN